MPTRGPGRDRRAGLEPTRSAGRSLEPVERRGLEHRLGANLSRVRLHTGARARSSAARLGAAAYTIGRHIVLGRSAEGLTGPNRQAVLGHEAAHTVQQSGVADSQLGQARRGSAGDHYERDAQRASTLGRSPVLRTGAPVVQRFSDDELGRYLTTVNSNGIEGSMDSDNKARAIVDQWRQGASRWDLSPHQMVVLIEEMLDGPTLDEDENAILELLERAPYDHLIALFGPGGVSVDELLDDLHGEEDDRLRAFIARRFDGGLAALRQGQVRPVGRSVPFGQSLTGPERVRPGEEAPPSSPTVRDPSEFHSYESWIEQFALLPTFVSRSGPTVIGDRAPAATATDPDAAETERRPPRVDERQQYSAEDGFIDGPTQAWVTANLPPNLVRVAYQLPSDCADIAVILRHVWLAAHHRSERFGPWEIGSQLGHHRSAEVRELIVNRIYSGNVGRLPRPYTRADGTAIRSWAELESRLHVGDMMVWSHDHGGGHAHTVLKITRDGDGAITAIEALQGNLPIGEGRATAIVDDEIAAGRMAAGRRDRQIHRLRRYPGRRIERASTIRPGSDFSDRDGVLRWRGRSSLVAAGAPVQGSPRSPGTVGNEGSRSLAGWVPVLTSARSINELLTRFESAVLMVRTQLETGEEVGADGAESFGRSAGERLWRLASARSAAMVNANRVSPTLDAGDLGETGHYRPLQHLLGLLEAVGQRSRSTRTAEVFDRIAGALEPAGRGLSSVSFETGSPRVLVTGFDPFDPSLNGPPEPGRINPSGAAALALDGTAVGATQVEGAVLPVSYQRFRLGLVESLIDRSAPPQAVITLSMSPGLGPDGPLKLERFTVGVHALYRDRLTQIGERRLEPTDPAPGQSDAGPAIIEAMGADDLANRTGLGTDELVEDRTVQVRFPSADEADQALEALGLAPQGQADVAIDDLDALRVLASGARTGDGTILRFRAGGRSFRAQIRRGPAGSFLSNEVSYRMLRALTDTSATSFHLHTPTGGEPIPADVSSRGDRATRATALVEARSAVRRIAGSVRQIIRSIT